MKLVSFLLMVCLGSVLLCQDVKSNPKSSNDQQYISLLQLISTPEKFDGKKIVVTGFLQTAREEDLLFLHHEDQLHGILENAVRIIPSKEMRRDSRELNLKYVRVVGVFAAVDRRKSPFNAGVIHDIETFHLWSDPSHPMSERVKELDREILPSKEPNK